MRILFTTHQGGLAGSTHSIFYLAQGLVEKGHEVHLACPEGTLLWQMLEATGSVTCHHVVFSSYLDFGACRQIAQIVKQQKIELINAQGGKDRNLTILAKWVFQLKVKLIFTRRQRPRSEPWLKRWFHIQGTEKIILISEGLRQIFLEKGYPPSHLKVILNGIPSNLTKSVNPDRVEELREVSALEGKVIGCLSRKKEQAVLIEALRYLSQDYSVLFVGIAQSDVAGVIEVVRPVQRLVFTGPVSHESALHYLPLMDINVLASSMDGFGLVLVEAMQAGVPVIGSDFGGITDIIRDGENGFLFDNRQPRQLAKRITQLMEDEGLRQKFVQNGLRDANEKFEMERVVAEYEAFFLKTLN